MEQLTSEVERIATIPDLKERAASVATFLRELTRARTALIDQVRTPLVLTLRTAGFSHGQIAELLQIARGTEQKISEGRHKGTKRGTREQEP
jgi:DNA-directed RNA polymerase specialized sigma24 family protein